MLKRYMPHLTATENDKGVLDLDTVKGCTGGMAAHPDGGCYGACYAAKIAAFRGLDFATAVPRYATSAGALRVLQRQVLRSPALFVRIGTMGDPSHDWPGTLRVVRWVVRYKPVVIITKWWKVPDAATLQALAATGAVVNTSVSALDTPAELEHRLLWHAAYHDAGGRAVLRVVTCDFTDPAQRMLQHTLLWPQQGFPPPIDNPLRCPASHPLVQAGAIRVRKVRDLNSEVTMSLHDDSVYVGRCCDCPDLCGLPNVAQAAGK
jgi:hypothetical protein